jgi:hypothetical protein
VYDGRVHHADSDGVPLEMLDASALLWRLYLDGADTGDRFVVLADAWASRTDAPSWYVFNDLHAVIALAGAGRLADAERHVDSLTAYANTSDDPSNRAMTTEIGLPASRAIVRFAQDRYDDVIADLYPIRRAFQHFGGSHAQRDLLQRTLLEAALRAGQINLARALVDERLSLRDTSVYGWTQRARVEAALGHSDGAAAAERQAATCRDRFRAAT